jgi:hypothetical protein
MARPKLRLLLRAVKDATMPRAHFFKFEITDPAIYEIMEAGFSCRDGDPQPLDGTLPQRRSFSSRSTPPRQQNIL